MYADCESLVIFAPDPGLCDFPFGTLKIIENDRNFMKEIPKAKPRESFITDETHYIKY